MALQASLTYGEIYLSLHNSPKVAAYPNIAIHSE